MHLLLDYIQGNLICLHLSLKIAREIGFPVTFFVSYILMSLENISAQGFISNWLYFEEGCVINRQSMCSQTCHSTRVPILSTLF